MNRNRLGTVMALLLLIITADTAAQTAKTGSLPASPDLQTIRQQLAGMIQQAIRHSTFVLPDGTKAQTVPLLSSDDYDRARRFGDQGTTVLAEYLESKQFFEQLLAIRLLSQIGTESAKDVLDEFAEKPQLIATRSYAFDFVAGSGRHKDILLLQKIAATDPDSHLRARAIDVLQRYKKQESR